MLFHASSLKKYIIIIYIYSILCYLVNDIRLHIILLHLTNFRISLHVNIVLLYFNVIWFNIIAMVIDKHVCTQFLKMTPLPRVQHSVANVKWGLLI